MTKKTEFDKEPGEMHPRDMVKKDAHSTSTLLLKGEKISFKHQVEKHHASDEDLNARYAKGDVRIVTESARYSLAGILAMLQETVDIDGEGQKEFRYKLDPEYQRRHRWSTERKSRLIESFLMNVPVPPVFLYERDLARYEVMDGRQRLTALSEFYDNKFALENLQYWADLEGRTYSQLPSKVRDGIDRRYISSVILLKETAATDAQAATLKKIVFERLNSGGVELSGQETRNAVYNGPLNQLCTLLSSNECFRRMWGIPSNPEQLVELEDEDADVDLVTSTGKRMFEKMEDVELVLRFFAYRQIGSYRAGLNKISDFLDKFLFEGNNFEQKLLDEYKLLFEETIRFLWDIFGKDAFTVLSSSSNGRPTKIIYDPLMYIASMNDIKNEWPKLLANTAILRKEMSDMYANNADLFSGRKTNYVDTQNRNRVVRKAFDDALSKL